MNIFRLKIINRKDGEKMLGVYQRSGEKEKFIKWINPNMIGKLVDEIGHCKKCNDYKFKLIKGDFYCMGCNEKLYIKKTYNKNNFRYSRVNRELDEIINNEKS